MNCVNQNQERDRKKRPREERNLREDSGGKDWEELREKRMSRNGYYKEKEGRSKSYETIRLMKQVGTR